MRLSSCGHFAFTCAEQHIFLVTCGDDLFPTTSSSPSNLVKPPDCFVRRHVQLLHGAGCPPHPHTLQAFYSFPLPFCRDHRWFGIVNARSSSQLVPDMVRASGTPRRSRDIGFMRRNTTTRRRLLTKASSTFFRPVPTLLRFVSTNQTISRGVKYN
jgi:hypothetical protein